MSSKSRIAQLDGDKNSYDFTGLIVSLYEARCLTTRKGLRYVFGMVIRDSPDDFIFGQVWGSSEYLTALLAQLNVNRWVKLSNVAIMTKDSQLDEQYNPWTPSAQENTSHIDLVQGIGVPGMDNLKNLPVRDHNDFYKLADLEKLDPAQLANKYFNLLFAIREIGQVQLIKGTKSDRCYSRLELVIFDDTNNSLSLQMWDGEFIRQVGQWKPYHNIVFAVGVKIEKNSFSHKLVAKTNSKTIFTTNPDTKEAFRLYSYAKKAEGKLPELIPEIDQIKRSAVKCTVHELKQQLTSQSMAQNEFVLLNAVITCFDIDGDPASLFTFKCKRCALKLSEKTRKCPNKNCSDPSIGYEKTFNRSICLSDHTATLADVRIATRLFETMVGLKVEEFLNLDESKRTNLKWRYEFERKLALVKIAYKINENEDRFNIYFRLIDLDDFAFEQ